MADRTVNININYKVNTDDVKKAQQAAQSAQKATDQLRNSTRQYGEAGSKAGKDAANGLKQTSDAAKNAAKDTQNLSKSFGDLYGSIKAVLTAGIVRETVDIAIEMARLAGQVEGVERAFKRAFPNSVHVLEQLKAATRGTVSDFELMQRTLQATNLGVAVEQLPVLFEFAAARAQQTGESVDYLVDSIVRGIGRKSVLVLDNLGLSATRLKEKFDGAALASQSVADVTEAVAEIAQEELGKMGGYATTAATKVDQLTAAFEKLKASAAQSSEGLTTGLVEFLTKSVQGLRQLVTGNKQLFLEEARRLAAADAARIVESKAYKELADNQQAKFDFLQQEINSRVEIITKYNASIQSLKDEREVIKDNNPYDKRVEVLTRQIRAYNDNKVVIAATILALKEYLNQIKLVNEEEEKEQTGIVERKRKEIEELQKQIEKTNRLGDLGEGGKLTVALEIAQAELADLLRAFHDFHIKEFDDEIDDATESLNNFDAVLARVDSQLRNFKAPPPREAPAVYTDTFWDNLKDEVEDNWREITAIGIDINANQLKSIAEAELDSLHQRMNAIRDYYNEQQELAGDNERYKKELRIREDRETAQLQRQIFEREKRVRRSQALIDGAAGIVKAFATAPNIYIAIVQAALVAAQTANQIAIINRQQPRFAKGVIDLKGPGTGTSDSIPAWLSKGESVTPADKTAKSRVLLKAIHDGKASDKEISPDVLNKLHLSGNGVTYVGMDDSRIVDAIRNQTHPDYMAHANLLFEVRTSQSGLHKRIRRKSMG